jgi:hypothetical protein
MKPATPVLPAMISRGRSFKPGFLVLALFLGPAFPAFGQPVQDLYAPAERFNSTDNTNVSARAAAMGSAFVGIADDASAILSNPAGLASLSGGGIALLSQFGWVDTFQETAVLGLPLGDLGGIGFAGSFFNFGTVEGRDESGSLAPDYSNYRVAVQAGWGRDLIRELSLGLAFRGVQQTMAGSAYSFFSPELGILLKPLAGLKIGLDYIHPGVGNSTAGPLAATFRSGASWAWQLDSSTRLLTAVGTQIQTNEMDYIQGGLEFSYLSQFFVRGGYQAPFQGVGYSGFSMGGGLALAGFTLDYAYSPYGVLGNTHRFSIGYPFQTATGDSSSKPSSKGKPSGKKRAKSKAQDGARSEAKSVTNGAAQTVEQSAAQTMGQNETQGGPQQNPNEETSSLSSPPPPVKPTGNEPKPKDSGAPKDSLTLKFKIPTDYVAQGEAQEAQGRHAEAIGLFQKAVQQDPENVTAWWDMGLVYYKLRQKTYAVQCLEKVLKLQPGSKSLRTWLENYKGQNPQ